MRAVVGESLLALIQRPTAVTLQVGLTTPCFALTGHHLFSAKNLTNACLEVYKNLCHVVLLRSASKLRCT